MHIRKGDNVIVIAGKDKGKTGKVLRAFPADSLIVVEGVNVHKRHQRPRKAAQHGQVVDKTMPIHVSNAMVVDPKTNKQTRIGRKDVKGKKTRIALKSGTELAS